MANIKKQEFREVRVKQVPIDLRRRIAAYQRLRSIETDRDLTVDEACMDLWEKALEQVLPVLKS